MYCQNPAYHKQPDDPFNAPEIIRGAALTDVQRLHIYMMYCWSPAYHSFSLMQDTQEEAWWSPHHITNSQMVHSMHWRLSEGPLWLIYWGYKYIWCFVDIMHITAFHSCRILYKKLGGSLIISQAAGWTIQRTGDHWRSCCDWYTEVTNIYNVLLESCRSQTARQFIQCTGDHQRGCFDWYTEVTHIYDVLLESCISQLSIDVRYWTRSLVVPLSYYKQLDGPFNAPEIIGGAALTDVLRLQIYMMYCWNPAYDSFPLMWDTEQEAWWSPCYITNSQMVHSMHQRSSEGPLLLMYSTEVTNIYDVLLESCIWQLSIDVRYSTSSFLVPSSYHKQLDGPFNAPEIIRGAALTDILRLQICLIYCWNPAYHTASLWSKILNKKLGGPPIILQTAGWYISWTGDHQRGQLSANISNKTESKHQPTSAGVRIM